MKTKTLTIQHSDDLNTLIEKCEEFNLVEFSCDDHDDGYYLHDLLLRNDHNKLLVLGTGNNAYYVWVNTNIKTIQKQLESAFEEHNPELVRQYCIGLAAEFGFKHTAECTRHRSILTRNFGEFSIKIDLSFEDDKSCWDLYPIDTCCKSSESFTLTHYNSDEDKRIIAEHLQNVANKIKTSCTRSKKRRDKETNNLTKIINALDNIKCFETKKKAAKKKTAKRKAKKKV